MGASAGLRHARKHLAAYVDRLVEGLVDRMVDHLAGHAAADARHALVTTDSPDEAARLIEVIFLKAQPAEQGIAA